MNNWRNRVNTWILGVSATALIILGAGSFLAATGVLFLLIGVASSLGVRWLEERSRNVDRPIKFDPRCYYQASRRS